MGPSISDLYRQRVIPAVRGEILRESDEQIVGSDPEELQRYYYEKYALPEILMDTETGPSYEIDNYLKTIPAHQREDSYQGEGDLPDFECQRALLDVPLIPNKYVESLVGLIGSRYSVSYSDSDFQWTNRSISCVIETKGYGFELDESRVAQAIEGALARINQTIEFKNEAIAAGNQVLHSEIASIIGDRTQKIARNKERLSALTQKISIPLKKKPVVGAQPIRVDEKTIVQRLKPEPQLPEEYVLDEKRVNDIIEYLDGQAKNFETTPAAIQSLGEEDLRDLLLANLNSVFQGNATGETFSKNGKTDIYLKIDKGNILICECKIWGGPALYAKTIDQLRGYLTWRHNYGIIVSFVRAQSFTKTLVGATEAIEIHGSYIGSFRQLNETHFVSAHRVDDEDKEVLIHHLFYHLPK